MPMSHCLIHQLDFASLQQLVEVNRNIVFQLLESCITTKDQCQISSLHTQLIQGMRLLICTLQSIGALVVTTTSIISTIHHNIIANFITTMSTVPFIISFALNENNTLRNENENNGWRRRKPFPTKTPKKIMMCFKHLEQQERKKMPNWSARLEWKKPI